MNQIRKDIDLITESVKINEAWHELPFSVREDLNTIVSELTKLNEATLAPDQIQGVFQSLVTNRGEGGNTAQLAKKAQVQLTPLFAKITGNPKLKAILSKVGNAVPIERLKVMVSKLPDPAGKNASAVVAAIQKGAQSIENDEDMAAFKGLMMTVITIGMGVAGAGGPAVLGIIGTTAIFRTVVDSAIKAAAGGTVADIAKTAAVGAAKGAIAGLAGNILSGFGDVPIEGDENLMSTSFPAQEVDLASAGQDAGMSMDEIDSFIDNLNADEDALADELFSAQPTATEELLGRMNVGPEYADKYESMMARSAEITDGKLVMKAEGFGSSMGVLMDPQEFAEYNQIVAANGGGMDGLFSAEAGEFRNQIAASVGGAAKSEVGGDVADNLTQSFVHPEWKNVLSEEVGEDFDALVEQVGEEVAVFVMFEWYNQHLKDTKVIIEGMEHLQEHHLIENIEQTMSEAPDLGGIAKKVGGAYKTAVGKVGQAAKAVGSAAVNTIIKPILNSTPVKAFTNKIAAITGMQGAIDPEKLQADYTAAKSPTESDDVAKFLQKNAGATKEEVDTAFKAAGIEAVAPEEEPEGEQPEQPQGGQPEQPEQPQGGQPEQPEQPQGGTQPDQPQGGAQGTQGQQSGAQGTTSGPTGGSAGGSGAIGKGVQQAQSGDTEEPDLPELTPGKSETINGIKFTWDGTGWKDPQGRSAQGAMQQELMAKYGRNGDGTALKNPGLIQRAKDYMSGKTPGLAQKTRSDPKASTGKKLAGMAGAAIGGMFGKSGGGQQAEPGTPEQPEQPAQPGQPAQPQGQPQGQQAQPQAQQPAQGAPKAVPGPTTAELKMLQSKTLQGDLASAKALVAKLSELKSKGYDADKFIQAAAPVMKKGGLAKSDPQAYATFVKMARSMRAEAYEHMCAILEHAGLTWADIGYEVLISESVTSHVMLIPTDVVQMSEMKKLAGI